MFSRQLTIQIMVTICGTICTTALFFGCGPDKNTSQDTPKSVPEQPSAPEKTAETTVTKKLNLDDVKLKGPATILKKTFGEWRIATQPRYFGPDNLYDLINGGSEVFIGYGFAKIATQDYRNDAHPTVTVTVEVYDMGSPLGAFGRVSKYLDNMLSPKDAGKGLPPEMAPRGILGDGDLVFWRGKYLVHLTLLDENPEATIESITQISNETIPVVGKAIFDNIKDDADIEKTLQAKFPTEHLLERTLAYTYDFTAGEETIPALTCRYQADDTQWQLFASESSLDEAKAQQLAQIMKKLPDTIAAKAVNGYLIGALKNGESEPENTLVTSQLKAMEDAL